MSVRLYRLSHFLWGSGWTTAAVVVATINRVLLGVDIHPAAQFGRGLVLVHTNGIVVHGDVRAAEDCVLYQQVTLGLREDGGGAPRLGNSVRVFAGAKVLGPIMLGDGASVGANAVVLTDVPASATAVGVPAKTLSAR